MTKNDQLIAALSSARGISQDEAARLLDWNPKTVRAAISNLRHQHEISTIKDDRRGTVYRIGTPAKVANAPEPWAERFPLATQRGDGRFYYRHDDVAPNIKLDGKPGSRTFEVSYETAALASKLWARELRNRIGKIAMVLP